MTSEGVDLAAWEVWLGQPVHDARHVNSGEFPVLIPFEGCFALSWGMAGSTF